jgi:Sulfatase-modifying factor enzyme 1
VSLRDLSLSDWTRMNDELARRECEALARSLPHALKLTGLAAYEYCGRSHRVARFSCREGGDLVHFVLVPGGEVSLGFDGHDFRPTRRQIKSFEGWPEEMLRRDIDPCHVKFSILDYVEQNTSVPHQVIVPTLLVEVEAQPIEPREDVISVYEDDPAFGEFCARFPDEGQWEVHGSWPDEWTYSVKRSGNGELRVKRRLPTTLETVRERVQRQGMRLPTSDEWEYACGAGTKTLFRWGDDTPDDHYPTDTCAEDRELKRAWVLSLGKLRYEEPPSGWDLHTRPNLFGLRIADDPYRWDLLADDPWRLGGDGGTATCGGHGFFLGWLPLASAFRDHFGIGAFAPDHNNVANEFHRVRRVIPIP